MSIQKEESFGYFNAVYGTCIALSFIVLVIVAGFSGKKFPDTIFFSLLLIAAVSYGIDSIYSFRKGESVLGVAFAILSAVFTVMAFLQLA